MSDINLINNPGIQGSHNINNNEDVPSNDNNDVGSPNINIDKPVNKNKKYFFVIGTREELIWRSITDKNPV